MFWVNSVMLEFLGGVAGGLVIGTLLGLLVLIIMNRE